MSINKSLELGRWMKRTCAQDGNQARIVSSWLAFECWCKQSHCTNPNHIIVCVCVCIICTVDATVYICMHRTASAYPLRQRVGTNIIVLSLYYINCTNTQAFYRPTTLYILCTMQDARCIGNHTGSSRYLEGEGDENGVADKKEMREMEERE